MPLKLSVGLSKKIGQPNYGSLGASCGVEFEIDAAVLHGEPQRFHAHVHEAFVACRQAIDEELSRLHESSGDAREAATSGNYPRAMQGPDRSNRGGGRRPSRLATPAQLQALTALADRRGFDLESYVASECGVATSNQLTLAQASRLIDCLRSTRRAS